MDTMELGTFIAQLRKEQNITQKELADRLHVTDKAVSKWETGKGFPDLKLMEPLAQALGISLVELIQCRRQPEAPLTIEQAKTVVTQAMNQSERITAGRYLKLFRFTLISVGGICFLNLIPYLWLVGLRWISGLSSDVAVIGGAVSPTAILVSHTTTLLWLNTILPAVLLVVCVLLAIRVRIVEKSLK